MTTARSQRSAQSAVAPSREQELANTFVMLADSLVEDYDIVDLLDRLAAACVRLLDVTAAGLLLNDQQGHLAVVASSSEETRLLEIFQLQNDQGPCLDCVRTGAAVVSAISTLTADAGRCSPRSRSRPDSGPSRRFRCGSATRRSAGLTCSASAPARCPPRTSGWRKRSRTWPRSASCSNAPLSAHHAGRAPAARAQQPGRDRAGERRARRAQQDVHGGGVRRAAAVLPRPQHQAHEPRGNRGAPEFQSRVPPGPTWGGWSAISLASRASESSRSCVVTTSASARRTAASLAGQELGVGLGPRRHLPVALDVGPVPVVLPVLRQQDQRRGVGRLGREGQVEQDERVRIPVLDDADGVEDDPDDHEHGLADQESPGAEEPRHPLREPPERVGVVAGAHLRGAARNGQVGPLAETAQGNPCHLSLPSSASPRAAGGPARRPR